MKLTRKLLQVKEDIPHLGLEAGCVLELDAGTPRRGRLAVVKSEGGFFCERYCGGGDTRRLYRVIRVYWPLL